MNLLKFILILAGISTLLVPSVQAANQRECVILLHGLGRTKQAMSKLALTLKKHNYDVVNESYPSTKKSVKELAEQSIPSMVNQCLIHHPKRIHFVTHSMGGIILQTYLQSHEVREVNSIVMLGPPNHGSPIADLLHHRWIGQFILGPSIGDLTTKRKPLPIGHGQYQIGIIAGNYHINPMATILFHEPNDGKVSVSSTQMQQMNDWIVLPVSHTFMMRNEQVISQVLYFLDNGHFEKYRG